MTIEEFKKIYFKYDGSLFSIAREDREAYESYKLLNPSEEILGKWKQEMFLYLREELKRTGSSDLFNRMYNLSEADVLEKIC